MTLENFAIAKSLLGRIECMEEQIKLFKSLPPNIALLNKDKTEFYDASAEMDEEYAVTFKECLIEHYKGKLKHLKQEFENL